MNDVRFAKLSDIDEIKELIDSSISVDYFSKEDIEDFINNDKKFLFIHTDDKEHPVACLLSEIGTLESICKKNDFFSVSDDCFRKYDKDTKVILYKTTCTRKDYRKNGILTDFMSKCSDYFSKFDYEMKIVLCLVLPDGRIPAHNHVVNDGFKQIKLYKHPWHKIKSYCGYCNNEYCQCDGMLYIKENQSE